MPDDSPPDVTHRDSANRESAESMVVALRAVLDNSTKASGYFDKDSKPDEEMILWNRTIIPWLGRAIQTRSHCHVLEIVRNHAEAEPELRFGPYRLNKVRRAIRGVYAAIREATEQG